MARFILDYDTTLSKDTKQILVDNCQASMTSLGDPFFGGSLQYCLTDILDFLTENDFSEYEFEYDDIDELNDDIEYLKELKAEKVDYIEICF